MGLSLLLLLLPAAPGRVCVLLSVAPWLRPCPVAAGSGVPLVYYGFMCRPMVLRFHLAALFLTCATAVAINYIPKFRGPEYRSYRAACFIVTGGYGVFPISHLLSLPGNQDEVRVCVHLFFGARMFEAAWASWACR